MKYDIVIIGAGPTSLALAHCLSYKYKNIAIIEKYNTIGGLHRVLRVPYNNEQIFTEHSPRIYSNSYKNFKMLLKDMNKDFYDLFTPYDFSMLEIGNETIFSVLNYKELFSFVKEFIKLIFNNNHGKNITLSEFMTKNNFNPKSYDLIDRMARLTDGASADRYTLYEFLQIANQQAFYKIFQPRLPNDIGLFKVWKEFLESKNVKFILDTTVNKININENIISSIETTNSDIIETELLVLAIPPMSILKILEQSNEQVKNAFISYDYLKKFSEYTDYMTYISSTFHWKDKLTLPKIYGFPNSEWGIAFIVLSNYMSFEEKISKTVMTCTITISDKKSLFLNKTANECNKDEILNETFRQLKESFPTLPIPDLSLLSPEMYYENNKWNTAGKAFILSTNIGFLQFESSIKNLYNVGTQNGYSDYSFTSLESAVSNGITLAHILDPECKKKFKIQKLFKLKDLFLIIMISIVSLITIFLFCKFKK